MNLEITEEWLKSFDDSIEEPLLGYVTGRDIEALMESRKQRLKEEGLPAETEEECRRAVRRGLATIFPGFPEVSPYASLEAPKRRARRPAGCPKNSPNDPITESRT